jgi:hypothetical protein
MSFVIFTARGVFSETLVWTHSGVNLREGIMSDSVNVAAVVYAVWILLIDVCLKLVPRNRVDIGHRALVGG